LQPKESMYDVYLFIYMLKYIKCLLPFFVILLSLLSCKEEQIDTPSQKEITFTIPDFVEESDTRVGVVVYGNSVSMYWTDGDTLGVFPDEGYQTAFPISRGVSGTSVAAFDGGKWALRKRAKYAAYFPFQHPMDAIDKTAIVFSYLGQTQNGNNNAAHLASYDYLASKYYNVGEENDVNFTLNHMGTLIRFQFSSTVIDKFTSMTLSSDGYDMTTVGTVNLTDETPALTAKKTASSLTLKLNNVKVTVLNQIITFYMMLPPMNLAGKDLTIKLTGSKEYAVTLAGKNMKAGCTYRYTGVITAP